MTDKKTCNERKGWPRYEGVCGKPAKFIVERRGYEGIKSYRCGIHAKRHKILEKI